MNVQKIEQLLTELLDAPAQPLNEAQRELAFEFAAGLFAGHVDGVKAATGLTIGEVQGMHTLAQELTFYLEYFTDTADGRVDAAALGFAGQTVEQLAQTLLDIDRVQPTDQLKQASARSLSWSRQLLVEQLAQPELPDSPFGVTRLTVNYEPQRLLDKVAAITAYRAFFGEVLAGLATESDPLLAAAKRALVYVHAGRLNAMAAVDVYPGLLSLEEQFIRSAQTDQVAEWEAQLGRLAPALGRIHLLEGKERKASREAYAKHLDAIRQGATLELDEVDEQESGIFAQQTLAELTEATQVERAVGQSAPTNLARELEGVMWAAGRIKQLVEAVLSEWNVLSDQAVTWQEVDGREGFAPDEKFQVVITPRRKNMSVDSTRRIVNIPEDTVRPLVGLYPAGVLPLVAHELSHVLQAYADYELGQYIPLARIKGRRYRILREAGGAYQEKILCRDYFGLYREPNLHYLVAYAAKVNGANRLEVARAFYHSLIKGKTLTDEEDMTTRELAVNRTARLYRYGGHSSQALDYVEQSIACSVLMERLTPEQVAAFLLGSASFSLEDSALLHRYGLLALPARAAYSPAHDVMRVFEAQFRR